MTTTVKMNIDATDNGSFGKVNNEAKKVYNTVDQTNKALKVRPASQTAAAAKAHKETEGGSYGVARGTVGTGAQGRDFAKQAAGLGGLVHVYATFAANIFAVTAAFNALSKAMDIERMQKATNILAVNSGRDLKGLAANLREVSDYAMSSAEAVQAVNFGTSAGLGAKQLQDLTKVAKGASLALGRDFSDSLSRVTRGAIKLEPELLDELGIVTKASEAYRAYGASIGVSADNLTKFQKTQAFTNAVISEGLDKYGDLVSIDASPFSKFMASFSDAAVAIGNFLNKTIAPVLDKLSDSPVSMKGLLIGISVYLVSKAVPALQQWGLAAAEAALTATASAKTMYATLEADQQKSIAKRKAAAIEGANSIIAANQSAIANLSGNISKGFAASNKKIAPLLAEISPVEGVSATTSASLQKSVAAGIAYNTRIAASTAASDAAKSQAQIRLNALKEVEKTLTTEINAINSQAVIIAKQLDTVDTMAVASTEKLKLSWTGIKAKVLEAKAEVIQFIADMSTANVVASQTAAKDTAQSSGKTQNVSDKLGLAAGAVIIGETSEILDDLDKGTDRAKKGIAGLAAGIGSFLSKAIGFLGWASLAYMALEMMWPSLIHGAKEFQKLSESVDGFKDSANNIGDTITKLNTIMQSGLINPAKQAQKTYEILGNTIDQMTSKFEEMSFALVKGLSANEGLWGKLTGQKDKLVQETKDAAVQILQQLARIKESGITQKDIIDVSNASNTELSSKLSEISLKYADNALKLKEISANISEVQNGWEGANKKLSEHGKKQSELKTEFQPIHDNMKKFAVLLDSMSTEDKIKQIIGLDAETKAAIAKYYPAFNKEMETLLKDNSKLASATQAANDFWSSNTNSVIALKGALVGLNAQFNAYLNNFSKARREGQSGKTELQNIGSEIATREAGISLAEKSGKVKSPQALVEARNEVAALRKELTNKIEAEAYAASGTLSGKVSESLLNYNREEFNKTIKQGEIVTAEALRQAYALQNADPTKAAEVVEDKTFGKTVTPPAEGLKKVKSSTSQLEPDKSHLYSLQKSLQVEEASLKTIQAQLGFRQQIGDTFSDSYKKLQDSEITQKLVTIKSKKALDTAKSELDFKKAIERINKEDKATNKEQLIADVTAEYELQRASITNIAKEEATSVGYAKQLLEYNGLLDPLLEKQAAMLSTYNSLLQSELQISEESALNHKDKLKVLSKQSVLLKQQLKVDLSILDSKIAQADTIHDEIEIQNLKYQKQLKINQANEQALEIAKEELQVRLRSGEYTGKDVAEDFGNKVNEWTKTLKAGAEVMNEAIISGLDKGIDDLFVAIKEGTLTLKGVQEYIGNSIQEIALDITKASLKKSTGDLLSNIFQGIKVDLRSAEEKHTEAMEAHSKALIGASSTSPIANKGQQDINEAAGKSKDAATDTRTAAEKFNEANGSFTDNIQSMMTGEMSIFQFATTSLQRIFTYLLSGLSSVLSMGSASSSSGGFLGSLLKMGLSAITGGNDLTGALTGSVGSSPVMVGGPMDMSVPIVRSLNAKGGSFYNSPSLSAHSNSIVSAPTLFAFAKGHTGLMGEAGPEAILPLKRDNQGNLGIRGGGGGDTNISINVDASGQTTSTSSGNKSPNMDQLSKNIASVVQSEIVKQKRPGGLLYGT